MNIHTQAVERILNLSSVQDWPALQELIKRGALPNGAVWKMPVLACEAAGGTWEQAIPAAAALACLQLSIILIDDLLDADPRGEYQRIGAPAAANFAAALQSAGLEVIMSSEASESVKLAALSSLNQMLLMTAFGQYGDVQNPSDEGAYWQVVQHKSSPFFGAALQIGALFGAAPAELANCLQQLGQLYGEMIQIHDDLNDAMAVPANADWLQGRSSLPILFAQRVAHPDQARFLELGQSISESAALAEAQSILIRSGAISYCVDQLLSRYQTAKALLQSASLARRDALEDLLEAQIQPVRELLKATGILPVQSEDESWRKRG
ncbi:Octaprenyl diphosphate synthase [Anaerolineae bacterium]|nr:Octaprenyl diphosphate synthase [Anaerolineae bacterium]